MFPRGILLTINHIYSDLQPVPYITKEKLLAKTPASVRSSSVFFGRAAKPPGYRAVSFWARASTLFQMIMHRAPRKDTLRISLAQLAGLIFSALCSQNTPTSSGYKSGDHISTALILRLRAGNLARHHAKNLLAKKPASAHIPHSGQNMCKSAKSRHDELHSNRTSIRTKHSINKNPNRNLWKKNPRKNLLPKRPASADYQLSAFLNRRRNTSSTRLQNTSSIV
jgi:hypothetical protein